MSKKENREKIPKPKTKISVKNKILFTLLAVVVSVSAGISANDKWREIYGFFGFSGFSENGVNSDGRVSVHFLDVGQGDCALILTPEKSVLIDSGERGYNSAVIAYLKERGVERLDIIIATHPHSDHIGGMSDIIDEFGAEIIVMPRIETSLIPLTGAYERLNESIENNNVDIIWAEQGLLFDLGGGTELEVIAPLNERVYNNLNDYSIVFRFSFSTETETGSFLFTGDIEKAAEADIADSDSDISADVLKVAHHGSGTSSAAKFINMVGGGFAVISVGSPNSYNHPNDEVLTRLENRGYEILRTDLRGNIVFDCTSGGLVLLNAFFKFQVFKSFAA